MKRSKRTLAPREKRLHGSRYQLIERSAKKPRTGQCECTSAAGKGKKLYPSRWQASRTGADTARLRGDGSLWETYKCPKGEGWHIATLRVDPWKESA